VRVCVVGDDFWKIQLLNIGLDMAATFSERELSADAGALGFVASNDSLVFIVLWCEVAAALVLGAAFILNPDPIPTATITPKDVHDR